LTKGAISDLSVWCGTSAICWSADGDAVPYEFHSENHFGQGVLADETLLSNFLDEQDNNVNFVSFEWVEEEEIEANFTSCLADEAVLPGDTLETLNTEPSQPTEIQPLIDHGSRFSNIDHSCLWIASDMGLCYHQLIPFWLSPI
jgi:hypothetical protein